MSAERDHGRSVFESSYFRVMEVETTNPHLEPHRRPFIDCRPCVIVVPWCDNQVLTVTQYRDNIGRDSLEFPGGGFDDGDVDPLRKAQEELLQETGYSGGDWIYLTDGNQPTPFSLTRQKVHCFLTINPFKAADPNLDDTERDLVSQWLSVDLLEEHIAAGRMTNCTNHTAWVLAAIHLRRNLHIRS